MKPILSKLTAFSLAVLLSMWACTEKDVYAPDVPVEGKANTISGVVLAFNRPALLQMLKYGQ